MGARGGENEAMVLELWRAEPNWEGVEGWLRFMSLQTLLWANRELLKGELDE